MQLKTLLTFATVALTVQSAPLIAEREPQGLGGVIGTVLPSGGNPALSPVGAILAPFSAIINPQLDALQGILNAEQIRQVLNTLAAIIPQRPINKEKREAEPQILTNPGGVPQDLQNVIRSQINALLFSLQTDPSQDNIAEARVVLGSIIGSIIPGFTLKKRDAAPAPQILTNPGGLPQDLNNLINSQINALLFALSDDLTDDNVAQVRVIVGSIVGSIIPGFTLG
ncbi:MAG: hypothetical protein M1817_001618 [Caeruleum heppii]|nr:MAG: hypothetical protein M1817_001618 [Caeruleum heppii]